LFTYCAIYTVQLPTQNRYPWSLHSISIRGRCHGKCLHTNARMRRWRGRNRRVRRLACWVCKLWRRNNEERHAYNINWTDGPRASLYYYWLSCKKNKSSKFVKKRHKNFYTFFTINTSASKETERERIKRKID